MNIARWIARAAESAPEHPAIAVGRRVQRTYRQFACDCAAIAGYFSHACRLAPGERVAVFMPNDPNYLVALCGAWHAGLTVVPINSKLHPKEVEFVLGHSGAELLITTSDLASEVGAVPIKRILIADLSEWCRAIKTDSVRNGRSLDRRSRMDLLYQRHDRASQRGNAVISQLDCADTCLLCRRRSRYRRKRGPPRGADVARVGAIWPSVSRKRRIVDPT